MKKTFDCVEMKNRLQTELREQEGRLGAEEMRKQRQQWLERGDDPLAIWWRSLAVAVSADPLCVVFREDAAPFGGLSNKEVSP